MNIYIKFLRYLLTPRFSFMDYAVIGGLVTLIREPSWTGFVLFLGLIVYATISSMTVREHEKMALKEGHAKASSEKCGNS